ncbi:MAG: BamA/TamA family outer membrane protein, partial [Microscillaceae bacterium]|nr:BamA/TamA family outer membrane protein [Microscillaceae bacterium]
MKYRALYLFFCCLLSACAVTRKLPDNTYLLTKQEIKGNQNISTERLTGLLRQKPNGKILFIPRITFYAWGESIFKPEKIQTKLDAKNKKLTDQIIAAQKAQNSNLERRLDRRKIRKLDKLTTKLNEGNWLMRSVGEKPTLYDSATAHITANQMRQLLQNKGFFQGKVKIETKANPNTQRMTVTYLITENAPSYFGEINVFTKNKNIDSIVRANQNYSFLKTGDSYDTEVIDRERTRIEKLLKNNGYLFFNLQYIRFSIDTNHFQQPEKIKSNSDTLSQNQPKGLTGKRLAKINIVINEPIKGTHKAWRLNEIYFHIVNQRRRAGQKDTIQSQETKIAYVYESRRLNYAYHVFDRRIRLQPDRIYSETNLFDTQRLIGNMDLFKFVNISPDTSSRKLNINIFTQPTERFQISDEIGLNVFQGLPGPFINLALKNRNTLGGAEIFETNLRFAIDGQTSFSEQNRFYSSIQAGLNASLTFPRLLFPRKLIYKSLRNNLENYTPTTRLSLGYNYVRRPEYTRTNLVAAISYQGQLKNSTYNFTLSELSVVNTSNLSSAFNEQLDILQNQGNPIRQSFTQAIVSSIYMVYTFNNNTGNETKKSHFIRLLAETGGNLAGIINANKVGQNNKILGLPYFQFWRFNSTFHYYLPLNQAFSVLAARFNVGLAKSYGNSTTLPYEKFFFAGGGSSLRAWQPRRLGLGESPPIDTLGNYDYRFEKPGEIILEGNLEWRFPLFGFIRGALFIDAGNVWSWEERNPKLPGSQFKINQFWQQIALNTGFGLRFNLPFLLFRVDLGYK